MTPALPEAYLPRRAPLSVWRQSGWRGLDRRDGVKEGFLSRAQGIDPRALPTLTSMKRPKRTAHKPIAGKPLSLSVADGVLYVVSEEQGEATLYREWEGEWQAFSLGAAYPGHARTILPFPFYNNPENPLDNYYNFPMTTIFPDGVFLRPDREETELSHLYRRTDGELPYLSHACLYLSRLFGVGGMVAYASDHNCVTKWYYDTANNVSASHAWYTTSQAGGASGGDFTAIVPFAGQLLAFKEKSCLLISGNKNPFRIAELLSVGTTDGKTVAQAGECLFFADRREVYCFDGEDVRGIGAPLGVQDFSGAIGAGADGLYYLYVPSVDRIFLYAPSTGAWSELSPFTEHPIAAMASTGNGHCLFLDEAGVLYSTEGATDIHFSAESSVLVPALPAPSRLVRLRLTLTADEGASLTLSCRFSGGRSVPLCTIEGDGRTERRSVRIPTTADTAASLAFSGEGRIIISEMDLVTAETATDGA